MSYYEDNVFIRDNKERYTLKDLPRLIAQAELLEKLLENNSILTICKESDTGELVVINQNNEQVFKGYVEFFKHDVTGSFEYEQD